MKKSILALLLAVLMVASLLPAAALADGTEMNTYDLAGEVAKAQDGDTITIPAGVYQVGDLRVEKAVSLKGDGVGQTVIVGSINYYCEQPADTVKSITVEDLTVKSPANNTTTQQAIWWGYNSTGSLANLDLKVINCEVIDYLFGIGVNSSTKNCKVYVDNLKLVNVWRGANVSEGAGNTVDTYDIAAGSSVIYEIQVFGTPNAVNSNAYYKTYADCVSDTTRANPALNSNDKMPSIKDGNWPAVAEVDGEYYGNIQEAVTAAATATDKTVTLLDGIVISSAINVPAGVTIDGGNHSITNAEGYSGYIINLNKDDSKNITLKNLVLDGNNYNGPILKVPQTSDISGFTANAVVFRNAKHGVYLGNDNSANLGADNIKFVNCNFENMTYAGIYAQRGNITVSDGCYFYNINAPEGETAAGILIDTAYFGQNSYSLSVTDSVFTNIVGTTSSEKATGAVSFTGSGTVSEFTMTDNSFYGNTIDLRIGKGTAPTFTETVISNNGNIKVVTASNAKIYTAAFYSDNSLYETIVTDGTVTMPAIRKSGYAFLGWVSGGKTYLAGETVTITANTTFTAVWVRHPDTPYVPEPEQPVEPETPAFPFYDVPTSAWYYTAVKYVYDNKLMDGVDTYVFAPNDTLTRAMVWTIIARMSGVDTTGGANWYAKAQEWVVVNGISDGENPTAAITRQELVTMLYRYAQIKGYDVSVGESTNILSYVDATSISEYAMSAFQWACGSGLTEGDENGALTPLATATRAQAAAMIMRFLSK